MRVLKWYKAATALAGVTLVGVLPAWLLTAIAGGGAGALGLTAPQQAWMVHVTPLLAYAFLVPAAWLATRIGARDTMLWGGFALLLGAASCGLAGMSAPSTIWLAAVGVAVGGALTLVGTLVTVLAQQARGRWLLGWAGCYLAGLTAGWQLVVAVGIADGRVLLLAAALAAFLLLAVECYVSPADRRAAVRPDWRVAVLWGGCVAVVTGGGIVWAASGTGDGIAWALVVVALLLGCLGRDWFVGIGATRSFGALVLIVAAMAVTEWAITVLQQVAMHGDLVLLSLAGLPVALGCVVWRICFGGLPGSVLGER